MVERSISPSPSPSIPLCGGAAGERCAEKSQFAYIAGGVAGLVLLAIVCVLFVWMICARANRKGKQQQQQQQEAVQKAMSAAPPDAASQVRRAALADQWRWNGNTAVGHSQMGLSKCPLC